MAYAANSTTLTFWDHLDVLRGVLLKVSGVTLIFAVISFFFKDEIFAIVFAPKNDNFITYRWLSEIGGLMGGDPMPSLSVDLINTGLAGQFLMHMKMAFCVGVVGASPYIIYQLFKFISPALYDNERRYATRIVSSAYVMFLIGILVSYFLIFPLTFRFLGSYQVSGEVANMISLQSYMSTLLMLCLAMGIVFELPAVSWILAKAGLLKSSYMMRYRKHSIVVILVVAAIITPTSDIFTLMAVSMPMWLLYELSIVLVKHTNSNGK